MGDDRRQPICDRRGARQDSKASGRGTLSGPKLRARTQTSNGRAADPAVLKNNATRNPTAAPDTTRCTGFSVRSSERFIRVAASLPYIVAHEVRRSRKHSANVEFAWAGGSDDRAGTGMLLETSAKVSAGQHLLVRLGDRSPIAAVVKWANGDHIGVETAEPIGILSLLYSHD